MDLSRAAAAAARLDPLPPASEYDHDSDMRAFAPLAARLLEIVEQNARPLPAETVSLALAINVIIARTRAIAEAEERMSTLIEMNDAHGIAKIISWICDSDALHAPSVWFSRDVALDVALAIGYIPHMLYSVRLQWHGQGKGLSKPSIEDDALFCDPKDEGQIDAGWLETERLPGARAVLASPDAHWVLRSAAIKVYDFSHRTPSVWASILRPRSPDDPLAFPYDLVAAFLVECIPELGEDSPPASACTEAADTYLQCTSLCALFRVVNTSNVNFMKLDSDPEDHISFARAALRSQLAVVCLRLIYAFEQLSDPKDASGNVALVVCTLQMIGNADGAARRLVSLSGSPDGLQQALLACVNRGDPAGGCPKGFNMQSLHVRAAMFLAILFGREETNGGSGDFSLKVVGQLVQLFLDTVEGRNASSPLNLIHCITEISISDANTAALVQPGEGMVGILDVFAVALQQGRDAMETWKRWCKYNVMDVREASSAILLNLTLSEKTTSAVQAHGDLIASINYALADEPNLSRRCKKRLEDILFHLDVNTDKGKSAALEKRAATADMSKHIMLSYCWAQQDIVKRIRYALGDNGYNIWIDIEAMQGSTVECMADAVDNAYIVCYGISRAYKESTNCRMECMYAHQTGTQMIPLMLEDNYKANGWLGMILGTKLWYGFIGGATDGSGFDKKLAELCRELGDPERSAGTPRVVTATPEVSKTQPTASATQKKAQTAATQNEQVTASSDSAVVAAKSAKARRAESLTLKVATPPHAPAPAPAPPSAPALSAAVRDDGSGGGRGGGGGVSDSYIAQPAVGLRAAVRLAAATTASAITTRVHTCALAGLIDAQAEMLVLDMITDCVVELDDDTFDSLLQLEKLEALSVALPQDKAFARQILRKVGGTGVGK